MRYPIVENFGWLLAVTVLLAGCQQSEPGVTTDMRADFGHDHRHIHGPGHDHEHDHDDDFEGGHSHSHAHGHRHDQPIHGGRVVSIGHSHHESGATHYHAEVMPISDGRITFHILTENADGKTVDYTSAVTDEILAYAQQLDRESSVPHEITFKSVGREAAFVAKLPEGLVGSNEVSVVVPRVKLGGERLNFSFKARGETYQGTPSPRKSGPAESIPGESTSDESARGESEEPNQTAKGSDA